MKLQKVISLVLTISTITTISVNGQKPVITLEKLWQEAEQKSQLLKVKQNEVNAAEQQIETAKNGNLPDITANLSVGLLSDGFLSDRDFSNWMHIHNPHFMNNFSLKASQLIYGGGAVKNAVELARSGKNIAQLNLENERQNVRMMIAGYYLDLCRLHNQTTVLDDNLKLCDIVISNMKVMESQGTALSNDILRYELQREGLLLSKRKVSDALNIVYHNIATATHYEGENDFVPDTTLISQQIKILADTAWQNSAISQNIAIKTAQSGVTIKEQELKLSKSENLPKVVLIAEEHFDGPITIEVPVLNNNFNYMFAGIGIQYNISSLYKNKRNTKQCSLNLETSKEQYNQVVEQIGDAIHAAYTDYLTSGAEVETQQKSVQLAGKNYTVTLSRYNNGLATITDMLDASNTKLEAELGLVNSKINLLYNYYKLKYITSTL